MKWSEGYFNADGNKFYSTIGLYGKALETPQYKYLIKQAKRARAETSTSDFPFHKYVPEGLELYPYQKAGIDYIVGNQCTLLADEQGLGKTIQTVVAASVCEAKKILIICPASLKTNWKKEFLKWSNKVLVVDIVNGGKHKVNIDSNVVIVNYSMCINKKIHKQLCDLTFDFVGIDEAHSLKNPKAKQTRHILGWTSGSGKTRIQGVAEGSKKYVVMTGTPIPNRTEELFTILSGIFSRYLPVPLRNYTEFVTYFCGAHTHYRFRGRATFDVSGSTNPHILGAMMRERFMIRRLKKDVLPQLPDKLYTIINLAPNKSVRELLKQEAEVSPKIIADLDAGGKLPPIEYISELRRELAEEKIPESIAYIKTLLETTNKVIVFAHHKSVVDALQEALKEYGVVRITGATTQKNRDAAVEAFQNGKARLFLGNIKAAGVGLTLTASSNVVMVESSWSSYDNNQCADRAHRIGQKNCVNVHFLVWDGSLDAQLLKTATRKQKSIDKVLK